MLALVSMEVTVPVSWDSLYLPVSLSNLGDSSFPCDLISLVDLGRIIDLQYVKLFTIRTEWQASYMQDWKCLEFLVQSNLLCLPTLSSKKGLMPIVLTSTQPVFWPLVAFRICPLILVL